MSNAKVKSEKAEVKPKKKEKPKLTLKLGEIFELIARYEEMTIIQQRGHHDADIVFMQGLTDQEKKILDLYMEKKIAVIFSVLDINRNKTPEETSDR